MNTPPGRSAASALLFIAIFTRLFWGMAADTAPVYVCAWLCPLAGLLLFLPLGMCISVLGKLAGNSSPWQALYRLCPASLLHASELLLGLALLIDCAFNMRMLVGVAGSLALGSVPGFLLLLPLGALLAAAVLLGMDAAGNHARLWNCVLPLLFLVVLLVHLPSYEARWLTPVLGTGPNSILRGGFYCGGCIALLCLSWLLTVPDRKRKFPLARICIAAAAAALQLAALQMLSPSMTGSEPGLANRITLILSNGRTRMPLQLLLMLISYGGLLHLLSAEAVACAGFLSHAFPGMQRWMLALLETGAVVALASNAIVTPNSSYAALFPGILPLIGILALILMLTAAIHKRRKNRCARPA